VQRRLSRFALPVLLLALPACGGGGGSSVPHTNPTPTPTPSGQPLASCQGGIPIDATQRQPLSLRVHAQGVTQSHYTFESSPSSLNVTVNGKSIGNTTAGMTPGYTADPYLGVIHGHSNTYSVCYSQLMDGDHTVLYNAQADTTGSIGKIASLAANDVSKDAGRLTFATRRPPVVRTEGGIDRTRIQVHFVTSAIGGDARVAATIERSEGAPHAYTLGRVRSTMDRIVFVPAGETPEALAAKFRRRAEVADARPLPLRYTQSVTPFEPNDPCFTGPCYGYNITQWDMSRIATPFAWGITHGSAPIAIIDTGADLTANDLAANITYQVRWVGTEPPYPAVGPGSAQDYDGHGTNVSGIADAIVNNDYGFAGVGFNAPLMILRIFPKPAPPDYSSASSYGASTADEAEAVDDAVAHGAKVINLSLGSCPGEGAPDPTEFDAIEGAVAAGVSVVAAAGNERSGGGEGGCAKADTIDFPAAYPGVIAVGATSLNGTDPSTATEHVSSYSNAGPGLAVVAPGGDPTSVSDNNGLHWITNLYSSTVADPKQACQPLQGASPPLCAALFAGTSQATPHVTGTVALMRSANANLDPARVKAILESTTDNINDPNQGFGRVDAYRAVAAAAGITNGLPSPVPLNFRAIAYTVKAGSNRPNILDVTFPAGVPVGSDGTFRVADVPNTAPSFRIGLWYDANGDGIVNAGDYFGSVGPCTAKSPCSAAKTIDVAPVKPGYVLK
jgi:subtilisin family serine protease